jgi:hypothetical protein
MCVCVNVKEKTTFEIKKSNCYTSKLWENVFKKYAKQSSLIVKYRHNLQIHHCFRSNALFALLCCDGRGRSKPNERYDQQKDR